MPSRHCILATLATFVTMYLLGFLIYGIALADFMGSNLGTAIDAHREAPVHWQMMLGQLAGATLLVTILSWRGAASAGDGFRTGAHIGFLMSLYFGFMTLSMQYTTTLTWVIVDLFAAAAWLGAAGAIGTLVLRRGN